jgi:hypothetical protein
MLEHINNLKFEDYMNKDIFFDIFKTNSKTLNSNILVKIDKHEKISNFFSEYTKQDVNSISKTLHNLDIKLSKIIHQNDKTNIKELNNYIAALSKMILLFKFLIKVQKIVKDKLGNMHNYLLNNFLYNESDDIYTQKFYQFNELFKSSFNTYEKDYSSLGTKKMNNINIFQSIPKNLEQLSLGKISQNNYFDGDSTPKFINADLKNFQDLKKNYNQEVTTKGINNIKENTNASLDESEYTKHSLCPSIFTLKKVDFGPLNRNNKACSNTKNNEKILNDDTKKEFNNIKTKTQTHFSKSHSKRNSHYSSSSKRPKNFSNFTLEKSNYESNKNYKKFNSNNSQKRQKESCFKKLNKINASKDVFVELFVLANELYKNEEINDQEKIIFKQLIINKSERLLQIFVENKDSRNNLVNSIKEVLHLILKNSLN